MKKDQTDFLKKLIETPSPSGFETEAQKLVLERMKPFADKIETDIHGNLAGIKNPGGSPVIMLAGHCDEVGYMVQYISEEGFLYPGKIGGPRLCCASGQNVTIHTEKGGVPGVMLRKGASHMSESEKNKFPDLGDFWIDIGAKDKKDAEKSVSQGDPLTIDGKFTLLKNDIASGRAFDDRIGSFIVAETLRNLKKEKIKACLYAVSTVQEEVGARGAVSSGYRINPDIAIAIDVVHATDSPEADKKKHGEISLGKGPVLLQGCNINPKLGEILFTTARKNKIPFQKVASPGPTMTDASPLQTIRGGSATALVKIPNRYMHAPTELVSLRDVEASINLLTEFIINAKFQDLRPLAGA